MVMIKVNKQILEDYFKTKGFSKVKENYMRKKEGKSIYRIRFHPRTFIIEELMKGEGKWQIIDKGYYSNFIIKDGILKKTDGNKVTKKARNFKVPRVVAWVKIELILDFDLAEILKIDIYIHRFSSKSKDFAGKIISRYQLDYPDELDDIKAFVQYIWGFLVRKVIPKVDVVFIDLYEKRGNKVSWEVYKPFYTRNENISIPGIGKANKLTPRALKSFISRALP